MTDTLDSDDIAARKEPRRIYPSWLKQPYDKNSHDLAETLGRIADRTDAWKREEQERIAALAWCRANGNPHIQETQP